VANTRRQDRQRAAALHLIHRGRYGIRDVARILGIPKSTVNDWAKQGVAGILNPRLRDVAQVERSMTTTASEEWDAVVDVILHEDGQEIVDELGTALLAALAEKPADPGCGCCDDCSGDCDGDCCNLCRIVPPTGAMVALFVPAAEAEALALPADDVEGRVEIPEDLHLTLAFLGDASAIEDPQRLARVVAGFGAIAPPIAGVVSGVGRFATGDRALWASFDSPDLPEFRQRLVQLLELAGYPPDRTHGFTPHITLAYPTGKAQVDVRPLEIWFASIVLAIAGQRFEFPLEGSAALFAEGYPPAPAKVGYPERSSKVDEPRETPAEPGRESGITRARNQVADERVSPPGVEEEAGGLGLEWDVGPPLLDRLYLEAMRRWFNLIRADVPHHRAITAVKRIDPDFQIPPASVARAYHALGKGNDPVRLGEVRTTRHLGEPGALRPPAYVEAVYKAMEMGGTRRAELTRALGALGREAYLRGLAEEGGRSKPELDPGLAEIIDQQAERFAARLADEYNRELAFEVYCTWVDQDGRHGRKANRGLLERAVEEWAGDRTERWADEITLSEASRWVQVAQAEAAS